MKNLVPSLILFSKYLEPQILADELAKLLTTAKKHAKAIYEFRTILRTLSIKRGFGYKIALIGRINSAVKTRILSITRFNKQNTQQTLSKNVSFATAQIKARIGAFGIKV